MRFRIKHTTRFDYDSPAYDSHNELRMCPWNRNGQRCLQFELKSEPAGAILAFDDFYGNQGHSLSVADPHDALAITATSTVEIANPDYLNYPDVPFSRFLSGDGERGNQFYEFLAQSRYIPFSERLRKFFWNGARPRGSDDVAEYVMRVVCYVRDQFEYETTKTHVHSSLNEILKSGGGVCQDFAHLTIGLLRLAGVPARYVSGYIAPARFTGGDTLGEQASHAWLEAWLPGPGWVGFDPTHRCRTDQRHIGVAIGRDYGDVPPVRGAYRSDGTKSLMSVDLSIGLASDENAVRLLHPVKRAQSQQ
ncbi:MAG TPA: transglutaminase family protein [Candidatus Binataceae bacterium]|nr:transglutaminase family protein [Candidatus Binataceae bacterium]